MIQKTVAMVLIFAGAKLWAAEPSVDEREAVHLGNIKQVTSGLPRAGEGYFSPDGTQIVYQA